MKQRSTTAEIRRRMTSAQAEIEAAQKRLDQARKDLEDAVAAELVATLRAVDWTVLEDLDCGGMLVRIIGWGRYAKTARRFVEKPGCLVSGCSDARIAVSNRTMSLLERSGLAAWDRPLDEPHQLKITELGKRHIERRRKEQVRLAA